MIKINEENKIKKFGELRQGSLFRFEKEIYIKTSITDIDDFEYAINVKNGFGQTFGELEDVETLEAELKIL